MSALISCIHQDVSGDDNTYGNNDVFTKRWRCSRAIILRPLSGCPTSQRQRHEFTESKETIDVTRGSAIAEEPRDALRQLKYYGRFLTELLTRSSANPEEPCEHTVS